jgi:hypothetical protein
MGRPLDCASEVARRKLVRLGSKAEPEVELLLTTSCKQIAPSSIPTFADSRFSVQTTLLNEVDCTEKGATGSTYLHDQVGGEPWLTTLGASGVGRPLDYGLRPTLGASG